MSRDAVKIKADITRRMAELEPIVKEYERLQIIEAAFDDIANMRSPREAFTGGRIRRGVPTKYPWDRWCNGAIWRITRFVEYESKTGSMVQLLRNRANANGMSVDIRRPLDDVIEFKYVPDLLDLVTGS
jgi:hypothetical protein